MSDPLLVDAHTIIRIAADAARDPRVVRRVLAGRPATATSHAAIVAAVTRLGLRIVVPPRVAPAARLSQSEPPAA